eukprot:SAG31_NODE_1334_length_8741_cov_4.311618_2_plen_340_part_00
MQYIVESLDAEIEDRDEQGRTAFHIACDAGHAKCIKHLHAAGCEIGNRDSSNQSGLMMAASAGHLAVVELLIELDSAEVFEVDDHGRTAFHHACQLGREQIVTAMFDAPNIDAEAVMAIKDNAGYTGIMLAAYAGNSEKLLPLLQSAKSAETLAREAAEREAAKLELEQKRKAREQERREQEKLAAIAAGEDIEDLPPEDVQALMQKFRQLRLEPLKCQLARRGLATDGTKDDLLRRLEPYLKWQATLARAGASNHFAGRHLQPMADVPLCQFVFQPDDSALGFTIDGPIEGPHYIATVEPGSQAAELGVLEKVCPETVAITMMHLPYCNADILICPCC